MSGTGMTMRFFHAIALVVAIMSTAFVSVCFAETTVITTEASYTMGDGESPSFAEAQVLQKAKQAALEQAGTYVEAYTKTQNYDLTIEEIQTLAGGVMKVEVLEKTRTLVGEGLQFYTKIKATVTTDKMQELAQRIRGKNIAEDYKKLQAEYARLSHELETWKQVASGPATGAERQKALDRIKENEKTFAQVQENEATLFRRLLSGQVLIAQAQDDKAAIGQLIDDIVVAGHEVVVGRVSVNLPTDASETAARPVPKWFPWGNWPLSDAGGVIVSIPITVRASPSLAGILTDAARSFGGNGILPREPNAYSREQTGLSYDFGYDERMQVEQTIVLSRPLAQVEQTFDRLTGLYAGSLDTRVKGTEFLLSGIRHISGDFQQQLADLVLDIRLSLEDGTKYSCAAYSIVNRLIPARTEIAWFKADLSNRNSKDYNTVLLLNNAISFEVEFALPEKMVTHLKGAEARYVKLKQAPKERCRMILPTR